MANCLISNHLSSITFIGKPNKLSLSNTCLTRNIGLVNNNLSNWLTKHSLFNHLTHSLRQLFFLTKKKKNLIFLIMRKNSRSTGQWEATASRQKRCTKKKLLPLDRRHRSRCNRTYVVRVYTAAKLVSWCFKPSQPPRFTSGLKGSRGQQQTKVEEKL